MSGPKIETRLLIPLVTGSFPKESGDRLQPEIIGKKTLDHGTTQPPPLGPGMRTRMVVPKGPVEDRELAGSQKNSKIIDTPCYGVVSRRIWGQAPARDHW